MAYERTCMICGKQYQYCPHCSSFKSEPRWKSAVHDANCKKIMDTLQLHFSGNITDVEALTRLKESDLTAVGTASDSIKNQVQQILDKDVKTEKKVEVQEGQQPKRQYQAEEKSVKKQKYYDQRYQGQKNARNNSELTKD